MDEPLYKMFSFFPNGGYERTMRNSIAIEVMIKVATVMNEEYTRRKQGKEKFRRIIVKDDEDLTVFEWIVDEGITYHPRKEPRK